MSDIARRLDAAPPRRVRRLPPSAILLVALSFANASNYLFQVVMGRILGPEEYGLLGGIYAVLTVVAVSTQSLQTASAKAVAAGRVIGPEGGTRDALTRVTTKWAAVVTVALALATPLLAEFLRSGVGPALALSLYMVPATLLAIGFGRLQGLEAFVSFAVLSVALAIGRLVLGPATYWLGGGVTGVVLVTVVLTAAAAGWTLRATRAAGSTPSSALGGDIARAGVALVLFWIMASIDVPIARNSLSAHDAGQYTAASVLGKAIIWLPSALSLVMFPRVASLREQGQHTHPPLVRAFGATLALCGAGVLALWLIGPAVIPLLLGGAYEEAGRLAWKVGAVCLPFALANLLVFYHLTRDTSAFLVGLVAALVAEVVAFAWLRSSIDELVLALGVGSTCLLLCLLLPGVGRRLGVRPPFSVRPHRPAPRNL